jgi:hypothetical protein
VREVVERWLGAFFFLGPCTRGAVVNKFAGLSELYTLIERIERAF